MHAEDEHDDKLVAEEMSLGVHTHAQLRAAEAARATDIAIAADVQSVLPAISEQADTLQIEENANDISSYEEPLFLPALPHSIAPKCQPASSRTPMDVSIHNDLANHSEIVIARALLKHYSPI